MSERLRSPLPDDPRYWEDLGSRIVAEAAGPLAARSARLSASGSGDGPNDAPPPAWHQLISRQAGWWIAASVALALALWLALPQRAPSPAFRWIERALAPDEAAGTLVARSVPPPVELLMARVEPASGEDA